MPYQLIAAIVAIVLALGAGFKLGVDHRDAQALAKIADVQQQKQIAEDRAQQIASGFEQVVSYQNKQIQKATKGWRDALNNPVYRDCKLDPVGLRILNERIGEANAAGQLDRPLPANSDASGKLVNAGLDAKPLGSGERIRNLLGPASGAIGGDQ